MFKKNKPLKYHQSCDPRGGQVSERPRKKPQKPNSNEELFIYENGMTDWMNGELTKEIATGRSSFVPRGSTQHLMGFVAWIVWSTFELCRPLMFITLSSGQSWCCKLSGNLEKQENSSISIICIVAEIIPARMFRRKPSNSNLNKICTDVLMDCSCNHRTPWWIFLVYRAFMSWRTFKNVIMQRTLIRLSRKSQEKLDSP